MKVSSGEQLEKIDWVSTVIIIFMLLYIVAIQVIQVPVSMDESWYNPSRFHTDAFQYFRHWLLIGFAILLSCCTLGEWVSKKNRHKPDKYSALLLVMAVISILSSVFSPYKGLSFRGASDSYENLWIHLSYISLAFSISTLLSLSALKLKARLKNMESAIVILVSLSVIAGVAQMFVINPLEWPAFKLFLTSAQKSETLFYNYGVPYSFFGNPNYLGSAMALLIPFVIHHSINSIGIRRFFCLGIMFLAQYVICGAGSAGALIAVPLVYGAMFFLYRKQSQSYTPLLYLLPSILGAVLFLVQHFSMSNVMLMLIPLLGSVFFSEILVWSTDRFPLKYVAVTMSVIIVLASAGIYYVTDHKYSPNSYSLERVAIEDGNIAMRTNEYAIKIEVRNNEIKLYDAEGTPLATDTEGESISLREPLYQDLKIVSQKRKDIEIIVIEPFGIRFFKQSDNFRFITSGNIEGVVDKPGLGYNHWFGKISSGRGYIWLNSLPLLQERFLLGTGPDGFLSAFPQNDVVGKYNTRGNAYSFINKPHSMYLQYGVQLGVPFLFAFLWLNTIVIKKISLMSARGTDYSQEIVPYLGGILGFLLIGLINDSKVFITPYYWIIMGASIALARSGNTIKKRLE